MSEKKVAKPAWYKNTYFWISGILFLLAVFGLALGNDSIRDPGQKHESGLWLLYLIGAIIMLVNGWLSHSQTVQHFRETVEGKDQ